MKSRLLLAAKILVTAGLLAYLLYSKIDWHEFRAVLRQIRPIWLLAALGVSYAAYFWSVDRWKLILTCFRIEAPYRSLVRITFIGAFFSQFLPSLVGGDFFRAYYLGRDQKRRLTTTLTSVILDRGIGFVALLTLGTVSAAVRSVTVQGVKVFPAVAAFTTVFVLGNAVILSHTMHRWLDSLLRRRGKTKAVERLDAVSDGLRMLGRSPAILGRTLFISFGVQLLSVFVTWLIGRALQVEAAFIYFLIFVPIITIITMIPVSVSGLGLREGAFSLLFSQVGVSHEACVAMSLLYYLMSLTTALPGGILYSLYKKQDHLDEPLQELSD